MPEVNQYTLNHHEVLEALLKHLNIHEGRWMLVLHFGFVGANVGAEEAVAHPTGMVAIQKYGVTRADKNAPPNLVLDAATVNPAQKTRATRAKNKK